MRLIYIYDAYCIWSYAFSSVFKEIFNKFKTEIEIEMVSGGMIIPNEPVHISVLAPAFIEINEVAKTTFNKGILGEDFLWHIENAEESDWFPNSVVPAKAFVAFKELEYDRMGDIIHDVQYGLFQEGRDLTDDQAYIHILEKYGIEPDAFFQIMKSEKTEETIEYEFELTKKLQISSFPTMLLQVSIDKFYIVAQGYENGEDVSKRITDLLAEINN